MEEIIKFIFHVIGFAIIVNMINNKKIKLGFSNYKEFIAILALVLAILITRL